MIDEVVGDNDVTSVMARLRTIKSEFPNPNPLEVLVESSADGRYTYLNEIVSDKMWYEEGLPQLSWETTGRDTTVCGYACLQAKARMYGRDWTVWFAPEIPVSYGPYVLGGLPGLIMDAEDADGLFHFTAVGLEQDPADAIVELARKDKSVKCTRKKYMELREKANGQSYSDKLREMGVDSRTVVKVVSEDGKDIDLNESRPKQNYPAAIGGLGFRSGTALRHCSRRYRQGACRGQCDGIRCRWEGA